MGFLRFIIFGYLGLTVIYWLISLYSRSVRLERLENEWAEGHPDDADSPERQRFLDAGMAAYHSSFRPKLIGLVYIIPTVLVIIALVVRNSN
ncbi:hypothetical protein K3X13_01995 [Aliiroseovarius crassostreae]|uniref:hypothetical protein n=1 Tax=Aliiroseovarius crassostreae TaxID=154981 RepID=UPI002204F08B|nr:hypothetical protein [Aliiroseovarius crassostreae]UWP92658.1 hypothetical protein K3X13_01995 [Aliiroseovarius crassostreae]UWP98970.1 hypothetical protein K3X53_02035 [Aliiroseovarius crassostreae]UWQ08405.1 hypothetical protein K3X25_02050 [Aliiroseovarius crassostreae]